MSDGIRELTVGSPVIECHGPLEEGWVEVDCERCKEPMRCREVNSKPKNEGDTVTLLCYKCVNEIM